MTEIAIAIRTGLGGATGVSGVEITQNAGVLTFTASTAGVGFDISTSQAGLLGGIRQVSVTSQANSNTAIAALDVALATVNTGRADLGATMNRLAFAADNLVSVSANATESRGRIMDADYAKEATELARSRIISQAGIAMLAQANQSKQTVLSLLK